MKIKVWIEVHPWQIGQDGEVRSDSLPNVMTQMPTYELASLGQRFMAEIDIPYKMPDIVKVPDVQAEAVK